MVNTLESFWETIPKLLFKILSKLTLALGMEMWRKEIFLGRHREGQVWRIQTQTHLGVFPKTIDHFVISTYRAVHYGIQYMMPALGKL